MIPFVIGFIIWQEREIFDKQPARRRGWRTGNRFCRHGFVGRTAGAELFVQRKSLLLMLASIAAILLSARAASDCGALFLFAP